MLLKLRQAGSEAGRKHMELADQGVLDLVRSRSAHLGGKEKDTKVCEVRHLGVDLGRQIARGFRLSQPLSHLLFD
jgi:hypothetical protein